MTDYSKGKIAGVTASERMEQKEKEKTMPEENNAEEFQDLSGVTIMYPVIEKSVEVKEVENRSDKELTNSLFIYHNVIKNVINLWLGILCCPFKQQETINNIDGYEVEFTQVIDYIERCTKLNEDSVNKSDNHNYFVYLDYQKKAIEQVLVVLEQNLHKELCVLSTVTTRANFIKNSTIRAKHALNIKNICTLIVELYEKLAFTHNAINEAINTTNGTD